MNAFVSPLPLLSSSAVAQAHTPVTCTSLRASSFAPARVIRASRPAQSTLVMQMEDEGAAQSAIPIPEDTKLFVGNLSWDTTDSTLGEAFQDFGTVIDARVVTDRFTGKSRGFGFIEFDEASSAEEALKSMNGAEVDGRAVRVDRAHRREQRQRRQENKYY